MSDNLDQICENIANEISCVRQQNPDAENFAIYMTYDLFMSILHRMRGLVPNAVTELSIRGTMLGLPVHIVSSGRTGSIEIKALKHPDLRVVNIGESQ